MKSKLYSIKDLNIDTLLAELEQFFQMHGHQVQVLPGNGGSVLQAQKETAFSALTGQSSALTIKITTQTQGTQVEIGSSKWIDKAAVGMIGYVIMPVLAIIPMIGMYNQYKLGEDAWRIIDSFFARSQRGASAYSSQRPPSTPPPAASSNASAAAHCANCGNWLASQAAFCSGCGSVVTAAPQCKKCGLTNHHGARFCSACGANCQS